MSRVEQRLQSLGLALPPPWEPRGRFLPFKIADSLVFLSGQICEWGGRVMLEGPVRSQTESIAEAQAAAQVCALNLLYQLREACQGDLDKVECVMRLGGFVNCESGFADSPAVINGATDVFIAAFGNSGCHARTAVGVAGLPGNAAVEVDAIVKLVS